ncbi:MAG TPA: hotdog domain-containing protein [Candidatus Dormibacteraeota bacterium]|nr:hotdog domain-containing protein [Candidatus Dormibacteraeota bacterium]
MGSVESLQPGVEGRLERVVDDTLLTRHVGGDGLFATPSMILLMEQTAHASVAPYLGQGQTTVGYEVCVRHLAPARAGDRLTVSSRLTEVRGNRLLFQVECRRGEVLIGSGTHRRAVVPAL